MSDRTPIEWADHTFNPWVGCTKVSPACDGCYAERWAKWTGQPQQWDGERRRTTTANWQEPIKWNRRAAAAGKRPRVFCASLADVFDNQVPRRWRDDLWHWIDQTPNLDWLLLTKRPQNIARMLPDPETSVKPWGAGWPNVWLGISAGNQAEADRNIPILGQIPAAVRFVSLEPLLGSIDLTAIACPNGCKPPDYCSRCHPDGGEPTGTCDVLGSGLLDWVIVGGESGPSARPMHPDWARKVRDDCVGASVPFFFKQWGEWIGWRETGAGRWLNTSRHNRNGRAVGKFLGTLSKDGDALFGGKAFETRSLAYGEMFVRVGKRVAGRLLDGRTWDEMPDTGRRVQRQPGSNAGRSFDTSTTSAPYQRAMKNVP
jgi:protein gp37